MCFRPDTRARRLQEVNLYVLRHLGIRALLLDADNTITPWNCSEVGQEVRDWVEQAKALGFAVMVISNNSGARLEPIAHALEINCFPKMSKPLPFKTKKLLRQLGLPSKACAVIGDQILTDVLTGKAIGAHTVLLDPIDLSREHKGTTFFNRRLERLIRKIWKII